MLINSGVSHVFKTSIIFLLSVAAPNFAHNITQGSVFGASVFIIGVPHFFLRGEEIELGEAQDRRGFTTAQPLGSTEQTALNTVRQLIKSEVGDAKHSTTGPKADKG